MPKQSLFIYWEWECNIIVVVLQVTGTRARARLFRVFSSNLWEEKREKDCFSFLGNFSFLFFFIYFFFFKGSRGFFFFLFFLFRFSLYRPFLFTRTCRFQNCRYKKCAELHSPAHLPKSKIICFIQVLIVSSSQNLSFILPWLLFHTLMRFEVLPDIL